MIFVYILAGLVGLFFLILLLLYFVEPTMLALPYSWLLWATMKSPPYLDMEQHFPRHQLLKDNWETIRDELNEILAKHKDDLPRFHEIDQVQTLISANDKVPWRIFVFKAYDNWMDDNCFLAPKTTALLKQLPEVKSAIFSVLDGAKHIPPHRGFYKGVLRYHLALKVPTSAPAYITVGGQKYDWSEGEDVIFDDSYVHSVQNEADEIRVVLFCDVFRKEDIPKWLRRMNEAVFAMRVTSGRLRGAVGKAAVIPR